MNLAERLLEICKQNMVEEELRQTDSMQVMYHLSPVRNNLLEWYSFAPNAAVLEVGAGAGTLTGMLAEKVRQVVALERDNDYLMLNQWRNQRYRNIEYRNGGFETVKNTEQYDTLILIGAWENPTDYVNEDDVYEKLLVQARQHIKQDGTVILALDNQLGMKYWAGAVEPHSARAYAGFNDVFRKKEKCSFTKDSVERLLYKCGYKQMEFYYPIPDFRFPQAIYSDDFLPQAGELRTDNLTYNDGGYQMFHEELAYESVCRDGKYPYFADSFLIFAKQSDE